MRIRAGFVSNSSSSSFVVLASAGRTVRSTAKAMMEIRDGEWGRVDEKARKKLLQQPEDQAVAFRTTNYDTHVMRAGKYILVSTCHNHDWYDVPGKASIEAHLDGVVEEVSRLPMRGRTKKDWQAIMEERAKGADVGGDVWEWMSPGLRESGEFVELDKLFGD